MICDPIQPLAVVQKRTVVLPLCLSSAVHISNQCNRYVIPVGQVVVVQVNNSQSYIKVYSST
jgi:hypothetical protein